MYSDQKAYEHLVKEDPLIYEFYDCGIIEKEMPIDLSNIMLFNPVTKKGDRVGFKKCTCY